MSEDKPQPAEQSRKVDGMAYTHCIAWHWIAGCGEACFEMCSPAQQEACTKMQDADMAKERAKTKQTDSITTQ
jgi:hypothetical protein